MVKKKYKICAMDEHDKGHQCLEVETSTLSLQALFALLGGLLSHIVHVLDKNEELDAKK